MSLHFNGWGRFMDRLEKAILNNPKPGRRYQELSSDLYDKEQFAREAFGTLTANPDWEGYYPYEEAEIKPIKKQMEIYWKQMFCKHEQVDLIGNERSETLRDICRSCGAEGKYGFDFGVKQPRKGGKRVA